MTPSKQPAAEPLSYYEDDEEEARIVPKIEDAVDANGKLINQQPAYDTIINAEVRLQLGDVMPLVE